MDLAQKSEEWSILQTAICNRSSEVGALRKDFLQKRVPEMQGIVDNCTSLDDGDYRLHWKQLRYEFVRWIDAEADVDDGVKPGTYLDDVVLLHIELLKLKLRYFGKGINQRDEMRAFGAYTSTYDMFLHTIAALMRHERYVAVHSLLNAKYEACGRSDSCWILRSKYRTVDGEYLEPDLLSVVYEDADVPEFPLIQADLVCMLHDINKHGEKWTWHPRLYGGSLYMDLPFFIHASSGSSGREDLLTCLGLENTNDAFVDLQSTACSMLSAKNPSRFFDCRELVSAMHFDCDIL